jgi:hypothetical protein
MYILFTNKHSTLLFTGRPTQWATINDQSHSLNAISAGGLFKSRHKAIIRDCLGRFQSFSKNCYALALRQSGLYKGSIPFFSHKRIIFQVMVVILLH